jgi:hypothetical protein
MTDLAPAAAATRSATSAKADHLDERSAVLRRTNNCPTDSLSTERRSYSADFGLPGS